MHCLFIINTVKHMMFGFGDGWKPLDDTAELMEELVVEYIHSMVRFFFRNRIICDFSHSLHLDSRKRQWKCLRLRES
jgi:hypothetical protein